MFEQNEGIADDAVPSFFIGLEFLMAQEAR
jgi:hypothetical protein